MKTILFHKGGMGKVKKKKNSFIVINLYTLNQLIGYHKGKSSEN